MISQKQKKNKRSVVRRLLFFLINGREQICKQRVLLKIVIYSGMAVAHATSSDSNLRSGVGNPMLPYLVLLRVGFT